MQTASTYPLAAAAVPASASASAAAAALAGASSNTIDVDTHRAFARYKRRTKTRATKIDGAANGVANGARGAAADGSTAMNDGAAAAASTAAAAASSAKSAAAADDDEKQREEDDAADSDDDEDDSHRLLSAAHIRALLSRHIKTAEDLLSIVPEKWPDSSGGSDSEGFLPRKLLVQLQEIISSDSRGAPHSLLNEFEAAFGCASSDPSSAASGAALSSFSPLAPLSTGNAHIDSLLQGGLWPGEVTEIVGSTCTGKTQLCVLAAVSCAVSQHSVFVIDTSCTFDIHRGRGMLRAQGPDKSNADWVGYLRVKNDVFTIWDLLATIEKLRADFDAKIQPPPALLVIDSLAGVVAPVSGAYAGGGRGFSLMMLLQRALKSLACEYNIAVLTTNYTVSSGGARVSVNDLRPALGESWSTFADTRILLDSVSAPGAAAMRRAAGSAPATDASATSIRVRLSKSPRQPPGAHCLCELAEAGFVS